MSGVRLATVFSAGEDFAVITLSRWFCKVGLLFAPLLFAAGSLSAAPEWRVLETQHFTVVSQLPEKETRAWAEEFNQFIEALSGVFKLDQRLLPRLSVVVFAKEKDFLPYLPIQPDGKPWKIAGFFSRHETWSVIGMSNRWGENASREIIFHEGAHWVMSVYPRYLPLCLSEGLAEVFSTFKIEKGQAMWGKKLDGHVAFLQQKRVLLQPVERLLQTSKANLSFNENDRTGIFYAQSWLFAHYLMFGERAGSRLALTDFLEEYSKGGTTAEAFRTAFGMSFLKMDQDLRTYLSSGQYFLGSSPVKQGKKFGGAFVSASPELVEMSLAKLAFGSGHMDLARRHAEKAVKIAPENPMVYDTLAWVEAQEKGDDAPVETLQKALQLGSKDAWTHVLLALAKARAASALGGLRAEDARRVANLLETAINLRINMLTAYKRLALALVDVEKISEQDTLFLKQGQRLFPDEAILKFGHAQIARKRGDNQAAFKLLDEAIANPTGMEQHELAYARETKMMWEVKDISDEAMRLANEKQYQEALDQLNKLMTPAYPGHVRGRLLNVQARLVVEVKYQAATKAFKEKRISDALALYREIIAMPAASAELKSWCERALERFGNGEAAGMDSGAEVETEK